MAMSIGEYAARAGLNASAVRYYESIGLLPRAARRAGRRLYLEGDVHLLQALACARKAGFGVARIKALLDAYRTRSASTDFKASVARKITEIDAEMRALTELKDLLARVQACDCREIGQCGLVRAASA